MPDPNLPPPDIDKFIKPPDPNAPPDDVEETLEALGKRGYKTPPSLPTLPAQEADAPIPPDPALVDYLSAPEPHVAAVQHDALERLSPHPVDELPPNPGWRLPDFMSELPGFRFSLGEGDDSVGDGGWRFGPLGFEFTRGCGCQALGCAGVLLIMLAAVGWFAFDIGPFHSRPTAETITAATPTAITPTGHCVGSARLIVDGFFSDMALNPGAKPPTFDTRTLEGGGKRYCLVHIATYHWNGGSGAPGGGLLSLKDSHGVTLGPWQAQATPATGGVLANWEADVPITPRPVVLDGTYAVGDSGPTTWSWSQASGGKGFVRIWAEDYSP